MIHTGDAIEVLATLPERHFHCVVTSPPYFGLRDYGTAEWEGGDAACDHQPPDEAGATDKPAAGQRQHAGRFAGSNCHKCGAKRIDRQGGLQSTPDEYVAWLVEVFAGVKRVLRDDGVCFVNLGDSYNANRGAGFNAHVNDRPHLSGEGVGQKRIDHDSRNTVRTNTPGIKPKDLLGMPWRVAFALQADGWWLRDAIVWHKPAPMPGSQTDRCTSSYEFVFQFTKRARYYWDMEAIKEQGAATGGGACFGKQGVDANGTGAQQRQYNRPEYAMRVPRNVWKIAHDGFAGAHFATFPVELPTRCIKGATSERGCCPACGAAWVRVVDTSYEKSPAHGDGSQAGRDEYPHGMSGMPRVRRVDATTGWRPGCECGREPIPCRVLDPFMGAGTTAIAANRLGRDWTGIELNPEYVAMALDRIGKGANPATHRSEDVVGEAPLFAPGGGA